MNSMTHAISLVGLQPLAKAIGVTYQAIRKFERGVIPAERVIPVSRATGWRVTPHQLRADLYPNAADGVPPDVSAGLAVAEAHQMGDVLAQPHQTGVEPGSRQAACDQSVELGQHCAGNAGGLNGHGIDQQVDGNLNGCGGIAKQAGGSLLGGALGHSVAPASVVVA